jgi:predicted SnoaL-like aldol condensation-catalyzing enzyme
MEDLMGTSGSNPASTRACDLIRRIGQDDTIWVRVRVRGTAAGPLFGPPSNKPVHITVFDRARIADGLIAEHWGVPDRFALLAQTGLLDRLALADSRRAAGG